jgi:hypothetical protein
MHVSIADQRVESEPPDKLDNVGLIPLGSDDLCYIAIAATSVFVIRIERNICARSSI